MRVVSLLPSATEIVAALGHEADLVGRSAECDFPASVRDRPVVMEPGVDDFDRPSREIDERVRSSRAKGESLYRIDVDALRTLHPDLLLTQDLCGVCSVTGDEVRTACREAGIDPTIVSLAPQTLRGVWSSIREVGAALGDVRGAERLIEALERRTRPLSQGGSSPTVALLEWVDPPIRAGLWVAEMIEAAGGRSLGPASGRPGSVTTWPSLHQEHPDLLVLSPCSFSVDRTALEIDRAGLTATLGDGRPRLGTWLADEAYFSRPGPRLADGVELLRAIIGSRAYLAPMPALPWAPAEA